MAFRIINIKDFTRRKNLTEVKGRLIGTHGKTKETIEHISGCKIIIRDHQVGIIGHAEEIEHALMGISRLIEGSKQSNVYRYLENSNKKTKKRKSEHKLK